MSSFQLSCCVRARVIPHKISGLACSSAADPKEHLDLCEGSMSCAVSIKEPFRFTGTVLSTFGFQPSSWSAFQQGTALSSSCS